MKKINVLLVDDVVENIQILEKYLDKNKYKTYTTFSGKSAIEICKKIDFDLLFIDSIMPELNGFETYSIIKENLKDKSIPVVFLMVSSDLENKMKAFQIGGNIITKPFHEEEIIAKIKNLSIIHTQRKELLDLNTTKDKLFSIIAHDLRGPIGNFKSFMDILVKGDIKNLKMLLKIAQQSVNSTYDLLENLLNWAKSQQNLIVFKPEKLHFKTIVTNNILLINEIAKNKKIEIVNNVPDDIFVFADKNMLQLILRNLISNSVKYTPKGKNIYIYIIKNENKHIITVEDEGVGIKSEDVLKLFKIGEHFTTYGTENEKGTGLGLQLCKEFVEKHNGEIWVQSELGKGSKFMFSIPL